MSEATEDLTTRECVGPWGTVVMKVRSLTRAELEVIDQAVTALLDVLPEFESAVDLVTFEAILLEEDRELVRAAADDYLHVMLDMNFFGGLPKSEQAGVLLHELFHVVDCDYTSAKMRARIGKLHPLDNSCQDAEINDIIRDLVAAGNAIALPSDVGYSEDFGSEFLAPRGLSGDDYYARLMSHREAQGMPPFPEFNTVDDDYFGLGLHVAASEVRCEIQRLLLDPARRVSPPPLLRKWAQRRRFIDAYAFGSAAEPAHSEGPSTNAL